MEISLQVCLRKSSGRRWIWRRASSIWQAFMSRSTDGVDLELGTNLTKLHEMRYSAGTSEVTVIETFRLLLPPDSGLPSEPAEEMAFW